MDNRTIAIILFLISLFVGNILSVKANKFLLQEKKAELIDLFAKSRIYNFAALMAIVIFFFAAAKLELLPPVLNYVLYFLLLILFMLITNIIAYRKLKKNNFPDEYIKSYILAACIRFLGIIVFIVLISK